MRSLFAALPLLSLAACGGAGTTGVPTGFGAAPPAATPSPTPTSPPVNSGQANLFDVTSTTSFDAVGGLQSLKVDEKDVTVYRGNASTVAAPSGTITYNPRDGIFTVKLNDTAVGVNRTINFQDPAHRSTADSARVGEYQVPLLPGFNYLKALDGDTAQFTFFYQRPGSTGSFVTLAGFERSEKKDNGEFSSEQGALVFGTRTPNLQMPEKGAGRYDGQFLATMVGDRGNNSVQALQWINGTSSVDVDFSARSVALSLAGIVGPAYIKDVLVGGNAVIPSGATFAATGSATWAQGNSAFAGRFSSAGFTIGGTAAPIDFTSVSAGTTVAGASSIDGTFYGPDARNIGGNFRITGGIPNQRIDVLGAFAGAKK